MLPGLAFHSRAARCLLSSIDAAALLQRRWGGSIAVYLLEDVTNRGVKGDVVEVKRGFARNFLIPRKRAVYATKENLAKFGQAKKGGGVSPSAAVKESNERLAELLQRIAPLQFPRAVAPSGSLFGSVSEADIRQLVSKSLQLSEEHLVVEMTKPVKEVGKHIVKINGNACEIEVTAASA